MTEWTLILVEGLRLSLAVLTVVAVAYQAVLFKALGDWFARPAANSDSAEPVTLLKPLHGPEPQLAANLASFLEAGHRGPLQMVCGVNNRDDAAVVTVDLLRARHPGVAIDLSTGPRGAGANAKIGNLTAMMPLASHDILILSDSDMAVTPDYLPTVLAALSEPGVGAATCLYVGRGDAGLWSCIGAAAISYINTPGMVLALRFGLAQPCMGSTIALRRETLERIGGFAAFRDALADDYAIGAAVRGLGLRIAVPPIFLVHAGDEASFGALWRHHLRWLVTLRGIVGLTHVGTIVTYALPLALLTALLWPPVGLALVAAVVALREAVRRRVDRLAGQAGAGLAVLCLADCIEFAVFCASLFARKIDWRGSRLVMAADGRIQART